MVRHVSINREDALLHLKRLTNRWMALFPESYQEIRCIGLRRIESFRFKPSIETQLLEAIDFAESMNNIGLEIYCTINPAQHSNSRFVSDKDVIGSIFLAADADDIHSFTSLYNTAIQPDFLVQTGSSPSHRGHFYWELSEPIVDLAHWTKLQRSIAKHHNSDETISNPSRILRLAGFVSYPNHQKLKRGYKSETVTLTDLSQ